MKKISQSQSQLLPCLLLFLLLFTASPPVRANSESSPLIPLQRGKVEIGARIVQEARQMVGIKEQGDNRGKEVEAIQRENGGSPGQSWCGYLVAEVLKRAKASEPKYRGGMAQGYINSKSVRASRVAKGYYKIDPG